MRTSQRYYQNMGGAPLGGIITVLAAGAIAAFILGGVYAAAIWFSPSIYLNVFFAVGFGLLMALALGKAALKGKVRSAGVLVLLALIVACIGVYVQWAAYITLFNHAAQSTQMGSGRSAFSLVATSFEIETFAYALSHPEEMFGLIEYINAEGFWSYNSHYPTGWELWGLWGAEAILVIAATMFSVRRHIDLPFSDNAGCWMNKQALPSALPFMEDPKAVASQLEQQNFDSILLAPPSPDDKTLSRAKVIMYSCLGDENAYLSITNFAVKKKKTKETPVIKFLRVDQAMASRIRQRLGAV